MTASATQGGHNKKPFIQYTQKWLWCAPCRGEELGPHLTQCCVAKTYHSITRHLDPSSRLAKTDMGRGLYGRRQSLHP